MKSKVVVIVFLLIGGVFGQLNKTYFKLYLPLDTATFKTTVTDSLYFNAKSLIDNKTRRVAEINAEYISDRGSFSFRALCGTMRTVARLMCDGTLYLWHEAAENFGKVWDDISLPFVSTNNSQDGVDITLPSTNSLSVDTAHARTMTADTFIARCPLWNSCNLPFFVNGTIEPQLPFQPGAWEMYAQHIKGRYGACSIYQNIDYIAADKGNFDTVTASSILGNKVTVDTLQVGNEAYPFKIAPYYDGQSWLTAFYLGGIKVIEAYRVFNLHGITFLTEVGIGDYPFGYRFRVKGKSYFDSLAIIDTLKVNKGITFGRNFSGVPIRTIYMQDSARYLTVGDTMWIYGDYPGNNHTFTFPANYFNGKNRWIFKFNINAANTQMYIKYYSVSGGYWIDQTMESGSTLTGKIEYTLSRHSSTEWSLLNGAREQYSYPFPGTSMSDQLQFKIYAITSTDGGGDVKYATIEIQEAN